MTGGLDVVDGDLWLLLHLVSVRQQRAAAMVAAVHVVLMMRLAGGVVEKGMCAVRDRRSDARLSAGLAGLSAALFDEAIELRERRDELRAARGETVAVDVSVPEVGDSSAEGRSVEVECAEAFARAHAASALSWALHVDPELAAVKAVYAAYAAIGSIAGGESMVALRRLVVHAMTVPIWRGTTGSQRTGKTSAT